MVLFINKEYNVFVCLSFDYLKQLDNIIQNRKDMRY